MRQSKIIIWLQRLTLLFIVAWLPINGSPPDVDRLYRSISINGCGSEITTIDHARTLEELEHAYDWNRLLDPRVAAINYDYLSSAEVLRMVDGWTPQIACIAHTFDIPPELLAGIMSLELDLDYHPTDAVFDTLVNSPLSDIVGNVEVGAAYAGVHFKHLRPALQSLGTAFSPTQFYQTYYRMTLDSTNDDLTVLATRYRLIDLTNAAVLARYYALLRMWPRPLSEMAITDMAFVWSAYRGGVTGTVADFSGPHRWSPALLQKADNPQVFGDTLIAVPYFSYFHQVFKDNKTKMPTMGHLVVNNWCCRDCEF
jgi:hypothetical protein